jgi:uncharacterized protein (TIGR03437 family)
MDAAQTIIKKTAFFLATALLLTAPFQASAQPTLAANSYSVAIGSSSCNDSQTINLTSSGASIPFTVSVNYPNGTSNGDDNGAWLYAGISGAGSTSNGLTISSATGTTGITLTLGLNRSIGSVTDTAQAIIQDTNTPSDKITITAYYAQNTSCGSNPNGNGFINISPGNLTLTAAANGSQSGTITIQNITGSGLTFGLSVSPTGSWLSASATTTVISGNGSTTIDVTANANLTSGVNTYSGFVTIAPQVGFGSALNVPVTFTVTNGTGTGTGTGPNSGTLTLNGSTSNTYTTAFEYVAPNPPSNQCITLQDTAAGANSYTTQVTTSNGGNWLFANNQSSLETTPQILAPGTANACVNLTLNPAVAYNLGSGAYQGSVALTSSSGSTASVNVNYYVSATGAAPGITVNQPSSGLIFVFPNVAANSAVSQDEVFSLTAATGYTLGIAFLGNAGNGFSMSSPIASNNTETFTVTSNSAGLANGIYATTVTMPSSIGSTTSTTTITIILPVGQAGATTTGNTSNAVAPTSLSFQQQSGSSFWTSGKEAQNVTITGATGAQWSAQVVYPSSANSGWLNLDSGSSGNFQNGLATLRVDLFNGVTSLSPSATPYTATVNIVTPSGTFYVSVSLLVTPSNTPVLLGLPALSTFSATSGANTPTQSVTVVGSDNTASTTSPPLIAGTPTATWVSATTGGNTLNVTVNATGQSTGVYAATIPVQANAYFNAINYPVVMIVNGGGGGSGNTSGALTLTPTSISFPGVTGQVSQNLDVTATTSTLFNVSHQETSCTGSIWLNVADGPYTATSTVTPILVTVNPNGIATGSTCTGVIDLASVGTQTVNVTMTVGASSGSGNVTVSPTSMTFAYTQNQSVPAAQTATIVNAASSTASIPFTVSTNPANSWLKTSVTSASTPYNSPGLSISVVPGSMAPNTYTGTVTIVPNGGNAVAISVTMTITGNAVVSATCSGTGCSSPTTLNMTYLVGGTSPTATIQVTGGGSSATFTAAAASAAGWLEITPTSGTTPNTGTFNLSASVIPSMLSSLLPSGSPYTGTITVAGTSPATGTTIINVTLDVTAPLPVITGITNAASSVTGNISVGEIISIYGTAASPIGPATGVSLTPSTCPGNCSVVPTSLGGVQVKFVPGEVPAPLLYVSDGQINAVVPYGVAGIAGLSVEVLYLGQTSNLFPVTLTATAPGIFTDSSGTGQAAALQYDNLGNYQNYNVAAAPAKAGWTLVLFLTGEGQVSPQVASGTVTVYNSLVNPPVPVPVAGAPTVHIGGQPATVSFYGEAPGDVSGVLQINVTVPAGPLTGAVPISVSIGTQTTQANVTVSLQ